MHMKEVGWRESGWICMAQNRGKSLYSLDTVTNIRISENAKYLWTSDKLQEGICPIKLDFLENINIVFNFGF
jgi:hypothetical protein